MKKINYEETEQLVEKKLKKLESGISYELPEEYYQTKKDRPVWRAVRIAASAAAVMAVIFGVWYAAEYAKHYSPPAPASADTAPETQTGSVPSDTSFETQADTENTQPIAHGSQNFPYEEPEMTDDERREMEALLYKIADESADPAKYASAKQYEADHAEDLDAAVAYDTKIFRTLIRVRGEKPKDCAVFDSVCSDICKKIIQNNGEGDGLYAFYRKIYIDRKQYRSIFTFTAEEDYFEYIGLDDLVDLIYEWKCDLASEYKDGIEDTVLKNAVKSYLTEFYWSYLIIEDDYSVKEFTFCPRQLFGKDYPVCLMLYDAYYNIDKNSENMGLPADWEDVKTAATEKSLLLDIVKTAEKYGKGDQSSALLECLPKIKSEAVGYGADIFKPIMELQKNRQEERGYKYLSEIDGHNYGVLILLDNGDAALAEICRSIFAHGGEAGFYNDYVFKLDRIFDEREYTEASVDGLYRMIAMSRLSYSEGAEAFDAAYPTCAAFYEAYRQIWFSSGHCYALIDAVNATGLGPFWENDLLNQTLYMTEREKAVFADKILSANGDKELVKEIYNNAFDGLSYFENLNKIKKASAQYLDFSALDLNGVDSIRFQPESPTAKYKGITFIKDGEYFQIFEDLLKGTSELKLFPLFEEPVIDEKHYPMYLITLYRGEERVLSYLADTGGLFFYNSGKGYEAYTTISGKLPTIIQAIEDAKNAVSITSVSDLDFSTLDLDGVDSIWFTPQSPSARYKGKLFTKDGKDSQVFNELLQSTAALKLSPLSEIPERAHEDVKTYRIILYRGDETVLTYRADTEANLFFIYSYINGRGSESVYTTDPDSLPPLIQAIEDAQKSYAE